MTCYDKEECVDCGVNCMEINEYYMVTHACWKRAGMDRYGGMLCIGCLEKRLDKQLQPRNFIDCPLNWRNVCIPEYASMRLASRLLGGPNSKWRKGALEVLESMVRGENELFESKTLISLG